MQPLEIHPVSGLPEIEKNCNLAEMLYEALRPLAPRQGDVLVITHKIISKADGLVWDLAEVTPSETAKDLAETGGKDPRLAEVILRCSEKVYSCARDIWIAVRKDGWICCNAGVDQSNSGGKDKAVLLPEDCDRHARTLSEILSQHLGFPLPVLICDTEGRALRNGAIGVAVGSYGISPLRTYQGTTDRDGRVLLHTWEAIADELASAATIVMGQGREGLPATLVRGYEHSFEPVGSEALKRSEENCIFKPEGNLYIS